MDSDRLNRWLTLGANFGVLIGIFLLIDELNQNREMTMAQTRNEISQAELSLLSLTAQNRDLSDVVTRANRGEELTPAEWYMWITRSESVFRLWQNVHYQGTRGMYDEREFSKHLETAEYVLSANPGLVKYWCGARQIYPVEFAETIDGQLPSGSCE